MRWLLGLILAILAGITLSVAILVFLVPDSAIERHILSAAERATNTNITSSGSPAITLFPTIDMTLKGVEMSPKEAGGWFELNAKSVRAEISWLSILTAWTIDIAELKLVEPNLRILASPPRSISVEEPAKRRRLYRPLGVVVRTIGIKDGVIAGFADWSINHVNVKVPASFFRTAENVDIDMFLNGRRVTGNIRVDDPVAIQSRGGSTMSAMLAGEFGRLKIDLREMQPVEGRIKGKANFSIIQGMPSIRLDLD